MLVCYPFDSFSSSRKGNGIAPIAVVVVGVVRMADRSPNKPKLRKERCTSSVYPCNSNSTSSLIRGMPIMVVVVVVVMVACDSFSYSIVCCTSPAGGIVCTIILFF